MMGIPPSEAKALTWWEYSAIVSEWNQRQNPESAGEVDAPDPEFVARMARRSEERGLMKRLH